MGVTVVIGAQWGDEAKGKMVDLLCEQADVVARYNGGDNAGHTVVNQHGTFKLRLTPNGFSSSHTQCVIGPGVVINLATLSDEVRSIEQSGLALRERLWLSPRCHVVMPYHPVIEGIYEDAKGSAKTGTTRRGMGPVYADKVSYNGIRLADLLEPEMFAEKLHIQLQVKNRVLAAYSLPPLDFQTVYDEKMAQFEALRPMVREPFGMVQDTLRRGGLVLLEGAQGSLLDNDWGTYPFCTASTTLAGGAASGLGLSPRQIDTVIGVAKAYSTRVGSGPMPTELLDETGESIRKAGQEYGTVTGRPRRCGWLDAEALRFTTQINGCTSLALTKLDVLDQQPVIRVGVGYRRPNESAADRSYHYWEGDARWLESCQPEYIELPGWVQSTRGLTAWSQLPAAAQAYVRKVEELVEVRVEYVSTGPERNEILEVPG